ncbi:MULTISPECIES: hypothetical protein [Actinosynnema]|uniref:hypothetical protein n=1 Tax=Actinosynnema TaxID=40566 RepID=UPI0020A4A039|nr:hypothetical protein [Actinosynnema pretiosum]MCP2097340.1 hypothetical protein [Actinosynnema pretiosum]
MRLLSLLGARQQGDALAFAAFRRPCVAVDAGLLRLFSTYLARFDAVVLHELAHVHGQNIHITYLTKSLWWTFGVMLRLPSVAHTVQITTSKGSSLTTHWVGSALTVAGMIMPSTVAARPCVVTGTATREPTQPASGTRADSPDRSPARRRRPHRQRVGNHTPRSRTA